ncbi:trans-sulfuration enzyme family protein [Phaeobacter sp. C3_T13_0]|uniref:trans-sulfuration enzyme family protein n=1 Tax=Phaeobacter cretensis TaxID=3342641 RepID=UPI0039BC361C
MLRNDMKPATIAAQAAGAIDLASGGVVPPLQPSTTFVRDRDYQLVNQDNVYLRSHNDAVRLGEDILSRLEGAEDTQLFPSGMAAIAAVFRTVSNGGTVIIQSGIYWGTTKWIRDFCARREITLHEVEASDIAALKAICTNHKADLVFVETPSNPWLKTVDIAAAKAAAECAGAILVVDSTAATPLLTRPLELGADIVMHSATKVINGHSDVLGGVLSTRARTPVWEAICMDRNEAGAVMGPFEAWLLVRSMRTLPLRVEKMCANSMTIAEFLANHPEVEDVFYPGLPSHEGHTLAKQQMSSGYGFLMSFLVKGGREAALAVAGRLNLFHRATSLGGVESLVEHRHTIEPHTGIPESLLRISIGIEDVDDLISDLNQALQRED